MIDDDKRAAGKQEQKVMNIAVLKRWLNENKVFFETLAAALLSLMALIISIVAIAISQAQLEVARQQTKLLELQTIAQEQQNLPLFFVNAVETNQGKSDELYIYNQGNVAFAVTHRSLVFLELDGTEKRIRVPINGYYHIAEYTGAGTDLVLRLSGGENHATLVALSTGVDEAAQAEGAAVHFEIKRYIRLDYQDLYGETHTDYYYAPIIGTSVKMTPSEGEAIQEEYDRAFPEGRLLDFGGEITAVQLLQIFLTTEP